MLSTTTTMMKNPIYRYRCYVLHFFPHIHTRGGHAGHVTLLLPCLFLLSLQAFQSPYIRLLDFPISSQLIIDIYVRSESYFLHLMPRFRRFRRPLFVHPYLTFAFSTMHIFNLAFVSIFSPSQPTLAQHSSVYNNRQLQDH